MLKRAFIIGLWLTAGLAQAQERYAFQDSIRFLLEKTKSVDAMAMASGFTMGWNNMSPEHQRLIRDHAEIMKLKKFRVQPGLVDYYGALVSAIAIENADGATLTSYLTTAGQVLNKETTGQAMEFFRQSRLFFTQHVLFDSKAFVLRPANDRYRFEYLELPTLASADTTQAYIPPVEEPIDTTAYNRPSWQQPIYQPEVYGPAIVFSRVSLNFITPYDSVSLQNTQGTYSMRDKLFVGEGGRFDWRSAGLSPDSVYYELDKYNFKTTQPVFKAEQGKLLYKGRLPGFTPGVLEFRSTSHRTPQAAHFPRFRSYETDIKVMGIGDEHLKYTGGFGLNGPGMTSQSVSASQATLELWGESDKRFRVVAASFGFKDSTISANSAKVTLYQENDSIYHPSVNFRYDRGRERVIITKDQSALRNAPFNSSFLSMDFSADQIQWDLKADSLGITTIGAGNIAPMVIESTDFYNPDDYRQLRGKGFSFHPLALVANYAIKVASNDFYVFDLAGDSRKDLGEVKMAMDFLAQKGMILYDPSSGKIRVQPKAVHVLRSVKGEDDFDNIKIHSIAKGFPNASYNLKKQYMTVRGVEEFNISDSLNVNIRPDSSVITLLQNRDIKFDGTITAGNFEITGKDFRLKYDSFFINLNHIDSIRFYVTDKNGDRRRVNNAMVGADSTAAAEGGLAGASKSSGTLFIARADNKSGKVKDPHYPRLDATAGGVIYFDRQEVLNGAYDRSIFFVVPPFKLDSLSDADPAAINFEGTFVTSGMFPSFKEKLHTMPDKSLGFQHRVPDKGYRLFNGDGRLYGAMSLDNSGIRATGRIDYLAASVESPDFIFYPDSVVGRGKTGSVTEKQFGNVLFPDVKFSDYQMKWFPKQDQFKLKNLKEPFSLYQNTAQLNGVVTVSKSGVNASGRMTTRGSEVASKDMHFNQKDFGARNARFEVKTNNPDKPALAGSDVRLKFDLVKNVATISPEIEGEAAIAFPYAQFKTSIPEARWDLNTQKIVMTKAADVPIENSYFYTTRKDLDSLYFNATQAEYDIARQQLKVSGIPFIKVADAKITPENNEVLILENAKIGQLKNTTIVLDTLNGYHLLTEGVVDIVSRKAFSGYATYKYINSVSDTFNIKMTNFHLEAIESTGQRKRKDDDQSLATQQTVAKGAVIDKDNIRLSPRIFYKGDMTMYATRPALQLDGYVKLDLRKIKAYNTWLQYAQSGDEKEIYLDFDNAVTEDGKKAQAGLHFASDNSLYITFVFDKKDDGDDDFFVPSGSLFYDSTMFRIEDRQKASGEKLSGSVLAYNEDKQEVNFEGLVNFFEGQRDFSVTSSAIGSGNLVTNDIRMNAFLLVDMKVPPTAFDLMGKDVQNVVNNENVDEAHGDATDLLYKVANIVGERVAKEYEQRSLKEPVPLPSITMLVKPLAFSNVDLKWSQKEKAFYNEGPLGLSHISRYDINGAFEGFMEVKRTEDGQPIFHVFIKASPDSWYYFGFEDNRMMVHSSNPAFNDQIAKRTNASKAKVGELVFIPGSDDETLAFINRFRKTYYGKENPYDLGGDTAKEKKKDKKKDEEDDGF